jgi:predicted DNA-binding transcriptional regulator AlpA
MRPETTNVSIRSPRLSRSKSLVEIVDISPRASFGGPKVEARFADFGRLRLYFFLANRNSLSPGSRQGSFLVPRFQLDNQVALYDYLGMAAYSTVQVAKKLGIGTDTLHRWINEGLKPPKLQRVGGVKVRLWDEQDFERAKAYAKRRYRKKNF